MANIKSANKKARKDIKRTKANNFYMSKIDKAMNDARKPQKEGEKLDISNAYSLIDKAMKRKVLSKQKSRRLKSQVATSVAK
jgi:ribosomal protein S20